MKKKNKIKFGKNKNSNCKYRQRFNLFSDYGISSEIGLSTEKKILNAVKKILGTENEILKIMKA